MLIDTGVWIDWLRGLETPATALLDRLLSEGDAWLSPVIVQELLQGARSEAALRSLLDEFSGQQMLLPRPETYIDAGALYARCRWRGITIRSPHDCLIATLAIEHATPLLTMDRDFEAIASVEPRLVLEKPTPA